MQCTWALRTFWICLMHAAVAEEVVTLAGRTFREATVRRLDEDRLELQHSGARRSCISSRCPNRYDDD